MELALYAPSLGYYVAGARKFGAAGDFVTGPELTPLYGAAVARQLEAILAADAGARHRRAGRRERRARGVGAERTGARAARRRRATASSK